MCATCTRHICYPHSNVLPIHCLLSSITVGNRPAHSSLYQMVKKRTLEARTKLQAKKYPNPNTRMTVPQSMEIIPYADDELANPPTITKYPSFALGSTSSPQEPHSQVVHLIIHRFPQFDRVRISLPLEFTLASPLIFTTSLISALW